MFSGIRPKRTSDLRVYALGWVQDEHRQGTALASIAATGYWMPAFAGHDTGKVCAGELSQRLDQAGR